MDKELLDLNIYVDALAKVHSSVLIGRGTKIWAFASVHREVVLGREVGVGEHTYIGAHCHIGDGTRIQQGCHLTDRMIVGENVFFSPGVLTCNDKHPFANNPNYKVEPPVIEDDVVIMTGAIILPGVTLGRGCRVGAGAIVTKSVTPYDLVLGNPARVRVPNANR